jgi:hypothetical protein
MIEFVHSADPDTPRRPLRWSRNLLRALIAIHLAVVPAPTFASDVILDQDRGIFSSATAADATGNDDEVLADEATDTSDFDASATAHAITTDVDVTSATTIESRINGAGFSGEGSAIADAETFALDARGISQSDSFFEVLFEAGTTGDYRYRGEIEANASQGDGYASVELVDVTGSNQLVSFEVGPGGFLDLEGLVGLTAGNVYRLTAFAMAQGTAEDGVAIETGDASFMIQLPEPSSHLLVASVTIGIAGMARRARREKSLVSRRCVESKTGGRI